MFALLLRNMILIEQEGLISDQLMCSVDVFSNGEVFICKKYIKQQAKRVNDIILVKWITIYYKKVL